MSQFVECLKRDCIPADPDLEKIKCDHGVKLTIFNFFSTQFFQIEKIQVGKLFRKKRRLLGHYFLFFRIYNQY